MNKPIDSTLIYPAPRQRCGAVIMKWEYANGCDISLNVIDDLSPFIQCILPGCFEIRTCPVITKSSVVLDRKSRNPPTENWLPLWYKSKTSSRQRSVYFWEAVLTSLSGSLDHVVSYPQRRMASWRKKMLSLCGKADGKKRKSCLYSIYLQ